MARKKSSKYDFRSVSIEQAGEGVKICIDTANRLIEAARILSDSGYPGFATFAVCTSIEEAGKAFLLLRVSGGQIRKQSGCRPSACSVVQSAF